MAKFVTHASAHSSTYLINGFIEYFSAYNAFHTYTETYRESPDPSFPVRDTESDPRWGWLGLACETSACVSTHALAMGGLGACSTRKIF